MGGAGGLRGGRRGGARAGAGRGARAGARAGGRGGGRFGGGLGAWAPLPLGAGAGGLGLLLANRALSGGAFQGVYAGGAQSRADVVAIAMAATLVLTGLQWLAVKQREARAVAPRGPEVRLLGRSAGGSRERAPDAAFFEDLEWAWGALQGATRCRALVLFLDGRREAHLGCAAPGAARIEAGEAFAPGTICEAAMRSGEGNYLANLVLFPGRLEFDYLPANLQGVAVQPLAGGRGVLVFGTDTVRGFSSVDQSWFSLLADKLGARLEEGEEDGEAQGERGGGAGG